MQPSSIIKELDAVALTCDLPEHGLKRGDVGTAVLVHGEGQGFEIEFVGYDGHTAALVTLEATQVRPLRASDVPHARELLTASSDLLLAVGASATQREGPPR